MALDADTGKLKWYFQFTPHDVHDWDAVADPVLMDVTVDGQKVKAVGQANRNGFYYALDRATGKLLAAKAYTKINWADGIGADGRPILVADRDPTEDGTLVCPGLGGGHNWETRPIVRRPGYIISDRATAARFSAGGSRNSCWAGNTRRGMQNVHRRF